MADFQAAEEDKFSSTTIFPRRMLKVEFSDGSKSGNRVWGIERDRVVGLDMNTTNLGAKVLLKGVQVEKGLLMMNGRTVVVEGGRVREKDEGKEERLIEKLRQQLGKPPLETANANNEKAAEVQGRATSATAREERGFSPDEDEEMMLAALEAEAELSAANGSKPQASSSRKPQPQPLPSPPKRTAASLVIPEDMAPRSGSGADVKGLAFSKGGGAMITLIDSDNEDDGLFRSVPDELLSGRGLSKQAAQTSSTRAAPSKASQGLREDPILIESSPEP